MSKVAVLRSTVLATGVSLLAVVVWFATALVPVDTTSSKEAVRFRNSLVATVGAAADFNWTPAQIPADFRSESSEVPAAIVEDVRRVLQNRRADATDFDDMLTLVRHLQEHHVDGDAISNSTEVAYRAILDRKKGWCSDFSQVFDGVAFAAGIPVREWGMAFDGFGGEGHAFNEIYDRATGKWIFVDAFSGIFVRSRANRTPLSVLEFQAALRSGKAQETVEVVNITTNPGFKYPEKALEYYGRGADQMYLWWANDVFYYDRQFVVRKLRSLPASVGQAAAIVTGVFPQMRIVPTDTNGRWIETLAYKRQMLVLMTAGGLVLSVGLVAQLFYYRRLARNAGASTAAQAA